MAAALLLSAPLLPAELWLVKLLVDRIGIWSASDSIASILAAAAWLSLLLFIQNIGLGVQIPMAMTRLSEIGTLEEQLLLLQKTARLPLASIEAPSVKDLRERAMQFSLYDTYQSGIQLLQAAVQSALLIAIMFAYGQFLPVIAACSAAALLAFVSVKSAAKLEVLSRKQTSNRRLIRHYAELMTKRQAAKEIRLFGLGHLFAKRWNSLYEEQTQEAWHAARSTEIRKIGPELLLAFVSGLLIALLVLLPGASKLSAGEFSLLFMALTLLLSQLPGLIGQGVSLKRQHMRWEDFNAYMLLDEISDEIPSISTGGVVLQVRNMSFRYPQTNHDTLKKVCFTIPRGCRAALVGDNGSGKSTLIKVLTGLYAPDEGELIWSNSEGEQLSGAEAIANMSAVFQDFTRFQLTLRENVALGKRSEIQNDPLLQSKLKLTGSKLQQLNQQLGGAFGGIEPSGGEWQKIATARALLREAGFVFYDEPTAALDPQAEKEAFDLFLQVTEGRSALLVTHRLGAARLADMILVLKDGRLIEQGTHNELMSQQGEYSRMFELQASWYR